MLGPGLKGFQYKLIYLGLRADFNTLQINMII